MKINITFLTILSCIFLLINCKSSNTSDEVRRMYKNYNVNGSFALYDLKNKKYFFYNKKRCYKGFLPASTFKIMNSLIALETGVIKNENVVIKWDKVKRDFPGWNRNHNLKTAIKYSVVWFYKKLARKIGKNRMLKYLKLSNYGNLNISSGIDKFWLEGKFRVSQIEQINFLRKLYSGRLPFNKKTIETVKKIIITEQTPNYVIRGKTGLVLKSNKKQINLGWWIGWCETKGNVYFFANNIEGNYKTNKKFIKARINITKKILTLLGII